MSQSSYLKCICKNCGGRIEFPSDGAGRTVQCPHCNWSTVLTAAGPAAAVPAAGGGTARKQVFRTILIAAIVVVAAGAGVYWYFFKGQRGPVFLHPAGEQASRGTNPTATTSAPVAVVPVVPPDPWHGLMAGPITLEKGNGNLVYAVGKLRNTSDHQRFSVKVELDVFNAANEKVGTATDYAPSIDAGKEWKFKALVIDRNAAKARLIAVKEN